MSSYLKIPVDQLELGPNPRKQDPDQSRHLMLKASIESEGLLHPLTVTKNGDDKYTVIIGSRRYKALVELAADASLPYLVPCLVTDITNGDLHSAQLAENIAREAMHPVDQWMAFKQLRDEGAEISEIALRFGMTEHRVSGLLKLSELIPKAIKMYIAGDLDDDRVMALTLHSKKSQAALLSQDHVPWAYSIRNMVVGEKPMMSHAKFDVDQYTGTITSDLFEEEDYADDKEQFLGLQMEWAQQQCDKSKRPFAIAEFDVRGYSDNRFVYRDKGQKGGLLISIDSRTGKVDEDTDFVFASKAAAKHETGEEPEPIIKTSTELSKPQIQMLARAYQKLYDEADIYHLLRLFFRHVAGSTKVEDSETERTYITTSWAVGLKVNLDKLTNDDLVEAFREAMQAFMPYHTISSEDAKQISLEKTLREVWAPDGEFLKRYDKNQLGDLGKKIGVDVHHLPKKGDMVKQLVSAFEAGKTKKVREWSPR